MRHVRLRGKRAVYGNGHIICPSVGPRGEATTRQHCLVSFHIQGRVEIRHAPWKHVEQQVVCPLIPPEREEEKI